MNKEEFKHGLLDGIPIALGYLGVSIAFGISTVNQGLKIWQALLISMFNETSAGQVAAVPIIAASGSLVELAITQLVINLRYCPMSISLSQIFDKTVTSVHRAIIGFSVTDEIFAVAMTKSKGYIGISYLYGLILTPWFGWSIGTLIGACVGDAMPMIISTSLGIAIYGMFIAIVLPVAKESKAIATCVCISVIFSLCFKYIPVLSKVSSGFVIIISSVLASAIMAFISPVEEDLDNE